MILPAEDYPGLDKQLRKILLSCGSYYRSAKLFFQQLWRLNLAQIGFRVVYVEKLTMHDVWDVRLYSTLSAQTYLLLTKPVSPKHTWAQDLMVRQLQEEIHRIANEMGLGIRRDSISVTRSGAYFRLTFIWHKGRPGRLLKREKPAEAFSFRIQPWLRRARN